MSRSGRRLAPWEELGFFNAPNVISTTLTGQNQWFLVAPNNPNRVALILQTTTLGIYLTTDSNQPVNTGLTINNQAPPLFLLEAEVGNLAAVEWFASAASVSPGQIVTAIEVILRQWPES